MFPWYYVHNDICCRSKYLATLGAINNTMCVVLSAKLCAISLDTVHSLEAIDFDEEFHLLIRSSTHYILSVTTKKHLFMVTINASELLGNIEDMIPRHYMHSNMFRLFFHLTFSINYVIFE